MINSESITFNRTKAAELRKELEGSRSFLLFGPRQTGKSTILEGIFDQLPQERQIRYNFQLPSHRVEAEADSETIVRAVEARQKFPVYLFIDEIQKVPRVMDVLQYLIDKKKIVLAASGSSARKMKTLGTNWLPGRIHLDFLYPLTWQEAKLMEQPARLQEHLLYGFLPGIIAQQEAGGRDKNLAAYTHLYLEEEIRLEAQVRNLPRFAMFLKLAALESGTSPNFSKIASQIGTSHTTVREYYQILEDSLITHRLPAFGKSRDQVLRTPKYYFFDIGVRNAAAQIGHSEGLLPLQRGVLFEHFVVLELIAQLRDRAQLYYWRTKRGDEVDLVIETKGKRTAVEIKATSKPAPDDFKGLEVFQEKYPCEKSLLVCQTSKAQKIGPHLAISWLEMLERIAVD